MKNKLVILAMVLLLLGLAAGYTKLFAADEDAFSVLAQLEKNYVGLEKPGLDTLTANVVYSLAPDITGILYYAKGKGLKTKTDSNGPNTIIAKGAVDGFVKMSGLGTEKKSNILTKENVTGTCETVTLKDGTKVTQLTFVALKGKKLDFAKMVMTVDTKEWVVKQSKITSADGVESVADFEYKDGLIARTTLTNDGIPTIITHTYTTVDKFIVPAKMEIEITDKRMPANMRHPSITYSDVKVNVKIADEIFAAPKTGDLPKPTETAAQLMQQGQTAMMKGDFETAKLKFNQLVTYYPDSPEAKQVQMILKNLPK